MKYTGDCTVYVDGSCCRQIILVTAAPHGKTGHYENKSTLSKQSPDGQWIHNRYFMETLYSYCRER